MRKCKACGQVISAERTGVTCSATCAYVLRAKSATKEVPCSFDGCGTTLIKRNPGDKWCSASHTIRCLSCGAEEEVPSSQDSKLCRACRRSEGNKKRNENKKKVFLERYGVESAFHLGAVQERVKKTNLEKYGVENQFQRKELQDELKAKSKEKYGVEWAGQRQDVKDSIRETNLRRRGVSAPAQDPEVMGKMKATVRERYGVENVFQHEAIKAKKKESYLKHYGVDHPMKNPEHVAKMRKMFEDKYGVSTPLLLPHAVPGRISTINKTWHKLLEEATGLVWTLEQPVAGVRTVDLYIEHNGKKLAVEPHPTATHNSFKNLVACHRRGCTDFPCEHGKPKGYHQERSRLLQNQGIQLISVFDWMPVDRVVAFVKATLQLHDRRVYARSCEVRSITQREANKFLKEFHMLGGSRKQDRCYGLYYEGELVQVQTFAQRKGDWEARRLATRDGWQIVGGVSKGTKRFVADVKPDKIVAFSDLSLSWPDFDSRFNGFVEREVQPPVLCWSKGDRMVLDKSAARVSADRLIGIAKNSKESPYPEDWSNEEVFLAEGWLPVWDCGKLKEVWTP